MSDVEGQPLRPEEKRDPQGEQHHTARELEPPAAPLLQLVAPERDDGNENHRRVVEHVGGVVEPEVRVVGPPWQLSQGQHVRVHGGQARRAQQLHGVCEHGEHYDAGGCAGEILGLQDAANAGIEPRLHPLRNAERDAAPEGEEVFHVGEPDAEGDGSQDDPCQGGEPDQQEDVQPCRHESEVHGPARHHEGAGDCEHPRAAAYVDEQREQEEQDPHRAGVETVQQAKDDREQRQAQVARRDGAEQRQGHALDVLGRPAELGVLRRAGRLRGRRRRRGSREEGRDARRRLAGAREADHQRIAQVERRQADRTHAAPFRQLAQPPQSARVAVDVAEYDPDLRALVLQLGEESVRGRAARTAGAGENLDVRRPFAPCEGRDGGNGCEQQQCRGERCVAQGW